MLKSTVAQPSAAMQAVMGSPSRHESLVETRPRPPLCDQLLVWCDRHRRALFLMMAIIYLAAFNGQWRMEPDAALYLSIGRNLAMGKGFTYLGQPNHLAYPGWPYLIAGVFRIFGTNTLVPVHLLMMLFGMECVGGDISCLSLHSGRPTAVVVTLGAGLTKTFFAYGFELWSDMPFTLGAMAFLAGYEGVFRRPSDPSPATPCPYARWYDWVLLFGGLGMAIVMRPTMWPLLLAVAGTILYSAVKSRMNWRRIGIVALVFVGFAAAVICLDPRRSSHEEISDAYEQHFLTRLTSGPGEVVQQAIFHNIPELLSRAASDVLFQVRMGPFNVVLSLLVLGLGVSLFRYRVLWGLWFCFLSGTILITLPLDRYFLPVIPLLIFAWWNTMKWANATTPRHWGNFAFAGLLVFGVGVNGSKIGGIIMQQRTPAFLDNYDRGTYAGIPKLAKAIHTAVGEDGLVLVEAPYGRVLAFLSERNVTNAPSTPIAQMKKQRVYVVEPAGQDIRDRLSQASLLEAPASMTVQRPANAGPNATDLSLHGTISP